MKTKRTQSSKPALHVQQFFIRDRNGTRGKPATSWMKEEQEKWQKPSSMEG
jgi:hypothetical protein